MAKRDLVHLPLELVAVALDTNSTGRDLQLPMLTELSDLMDEQNLDDAEIWVPEPVLWEWAEHVHKKLKSIEVTLVQLGKIGLPGLQGLNDLANKSVAEVVWAVETALGGISRVRILRLVDHPEATIEGLRDQILQTGAGKFKGAEGTKTGAADSATFRLVEAEAVGALDLVALVSADADTFRHYGDSGSPILVSDWNLLKRAVVAMVPSEDEVRTAAAAAIRDHLRRFVADAGEYLEYETLDGDVDRAQSRYEIYEPERKVGVSHLDRIGPAEIVDVSRKAGYASAQVDVTLTLFSQTVWYDAGNESVEQDDEVFSDVPAVASVWANRDGDEWVVSVDVLYVPPDGSDEASRVMEAVDTAEVPA